MLKRLILITIITIYSILFISFSYKIHILTVAGILPIFALANIIIGFFIGKMRNLNKVHDFTIFIYFVSVYYFGFLGSLLISMSSEPGNIATILMLTLAIDIILTISLTISYCLGVHIEKRNTIKDIKPQTKSIDDNKPIE